MYARLYYEIKKSWMTIVDEVISSGRSDSLWLIELLCLQLGSRSVILTLYIGYGYLLKCLTCLLSWMVHNQLLPTDSRGKLGDFSVDKLSFKKLECFNYLTYNVTPWLFQLIFRIWKSQPMGRWRDVGNTPSQKIFSPSRNKNTRRRILKTSACLAQRFFNFSFFFFKNLKLLKKRWLIFLFL